MTMRTLSLTVDELAELAEAVRGVPWLPLQGARYRAARSLAQKVREALAAAERPAVPRVAGPAQPGSAPGARAG